MITIGTPGEVTIPSGTLVKKGEKEGIPITSCSCSFAVGSIPLCRIGIPIEFLSEIPTKSNQDIYEVKVGVDDKQYTVFTGYVSGRCGKISERSVEAGISLVHPARDMDTMRLLAPGMHSQGEIDYTYYAANNGDGQSPMDITNFYYKEAEGTPLAQQLIDALIKTLKSWHTVRTLNTSDAVPIQDDVKYEKTIKILKSIKVQGSSLMVIGNRLETSIDMAAKGEVMASINTQTSVWNTLTALFSQFSLFMVCDCNGEVLVIPDVTNFVPPDDNYFYSDQILSFDQSSSFGRNVREVVLLNQTNHKEGHGSQGVEALAIATDPTDDGSGGSIAMSMPAWLSPLNVLEPDPEIFGPPCPSNPGVKGKEQNTTDVRKLIRKVQKAFAQAQLNVERDKWKTMSFISPMVPGAIPGTTIWVQPYSSVKSLSGKELGSGTLYSGYLAGVQHVMDATAKSIYTTITLRNVSDTTEDLNITEHPIFTDAAPFTLG